jgi:hypothetical protein
LDHRESRDSQVDKREPTDDTKLIEDEYKHAPDRAYLRGWGFGFLETPTLQTVISEEEWG